MKKIICLLLLELAMAVLASCSNKSNTDFNNHQVTEDNQETITEQYVPKASDEEIKKYIIDQASLNQFFVKVDEFKNATFIMHSSISTYKNDNLSGNEPLYAYISMNGTDSAVLHLVGKYTGNDWIFFNKAQLKGDDGVFTIFDNVESYDKKEDVINNGNVIESYDLRPVSTTLTKSFEKLNHEKYYKLRFSGKDYYKEYDISPIAVDAIQKTIKYYEKIVDILERRELPEYNIEEETSINKTNNKQNLGEYHIDIENIGGRFAPAKYINIDDESKAFVISQTWDDMHIYKYSEIGTGDTSSRTLSAKFEDGKLILMSDDNLDLTITCFSDGNAICVKNGVESSYESAKKIEFISSKEYLSTDNTKERVDVESQEQEHENSEDDSNNGIEIVSTYVGQSTASNDKKVTIKLINHTGNKIKSIDYLIRTYDKSGEQSYSETGTYEFINPLDCETKSQINFDIFSNKVYLGCKLEFEVLNYIYAE